MYQPDPAAPGRYYVKDPVRGEFLRYNTAQVAMMRALDGKRTPADVQKHLVGELGVEIPTEAIARFVDRLEKALLLDVTSYQVDDAKTRKKILGYLRKRKLALRIRARDGMSPEAAMFEAGTRQLHEGDPCLAASYFHAVLEINPDNQRARQVLQCIQEGFFRSKVVRPSHLRMWHIFNPDRLLGWVDARFGRYLFSVIGVLVMLAIIISGAICAVDVMLRPKVFSALGVWDIPVVFAFCMLQLFIHEASHGLACKHYGGQVTDMGLMILHGVMPGAYCDVSDSYLFPSTREKVVVQSAGIFGHMVLQAIVWHLLFFTDVSFPVWSALLVGNLYYIYSNVTNLIPLAKLDGYYALAEILGITNLREQSFAYVKGRLGEALLGVPNEVPAKSDRDRRIFILYGTLASIYMTCLIYFVFVSYLLPKSIELLGVVGVLLTVLYFVNALFLKLVKYVIQFVKYAYARRSTIFTRRRTLAFAAVIAALVFVLALPWPLYLEGDMFAEPQERGALRALEPGVVEDVLVDEGARVEEGQVVAVLRSDELMRDREHAAAELEVRRAELDMMRRGARKEEVELARAQREADVDRFRAESGRLADSRVRRALGVVTRQAVVTATANTNSAKGDAAVSLQDEALVRAGTRAEELAAQEANVRRLEAKLAALDMRVAKLSIRSPISGVVVTSRTQELRGRMLQAGDEVIEVHDIRRFRMRIVPDRGEPLASLAMGLRVEARALGDSTRTLEAKLDEIRPSEDGRTPVVVYSFAEDPEWRSGMTGRARIYVPERSIAYRLIAVPLIRLVDFELWRMR